MRLFAISDLHVGFPANRALLGTIGPHPNDWLIVAGDVGESAAHLEQTWQLLCDKFARIIWTPGNHELWCLSGEGGPRGAEKYELLVDLCRRYGVLTPEDPFARFETADGACLVAPIFVLYDYSFRPDTVAAKDARAWAAASGVVCADEALLDPFPYASIPDWCAQRLAVTRPRLERASREAPLILVNHFPTRYDLVRLGRIPRFSIWCGTRATEDWHIRYRARVVVTGHLHWRGTDTRDGVRFEEVSLGYPRQWQRWRNANVALLRELQL